MHMDNKKYIPRIVDKLKKSKPVFMSLPGGGELRIERPLPYLLVYRVPPDGGDAFTSTLGKTESAYLVAPDTEECPINRIIYALAVAMADKFGGFMLLEVWLSDRADSPTFSIHISQKSALPIAEKLQSELQRIHLIQVPGVHTALEKDKKMPSPPYYQALYGAEEARKN